MLTTKVFSSSAQQGQLPRLCQQARHALRFDCDTMLDTMLAADDNVTDTNRDLLQGPDLAKGTVPV